MQTSESGETMRRKNQLCVYVTRLLPVVVELFQGVEGGDEDTRPNPCNQKLARHPHAHNICLVPCNTGNPNQNHQVHITKLHTNYRHQMRTTLPLVVGVIFAPPQLSYFNSMSVCFTVCVIAGLGLFPCVLTLNYNHRLASDRSQAFL